MPRFRTDSVGLRYEEGLVAAILELAVRDALGPPGRDRASAWAYLAGPVYEDHLALLNLPADSVPVPIEELAHAQAS